MTTPENPPGRNDPCHCGSGRKYKQCHLDKDEAAARAARAKEAVQAPAASEPAPSASPARASQRPRAEQPWKRAAQNTRGFHKVTTPRKVGGG